MCTHQHIERAIESHLQPTLGVLGKRSQEGLLEDGGSKRVGNAHESVGRICKRLHL